MGWIEWTIGSFIVVLVVLVFLFVLTRERRNRKLRIGFFLERERFEDDDP